MRNRSLALCFLAASLLGGCGKVLAPAAPGSANSTTPAYTYPFTLSFGSIGNGNGAFESPEGIAATDGSIFVCDNQNGRVERFNLQGYYQSQFGTSVSGFRPQGLAIGGNGIIYATDEGNEKVQAFDLNGNYFPSALIGGITTTAFSNPYGIAVDSGSNLYITEITNNRIQKCGTTFGSGCVTVGGTASGTGPSQFNAPQGIALDASGNVWVADTVNSRIQEFNSNLGYLSQFSTGAFSYPTGIVVDSDGNLIVVLSNDRIVGKYDTKGNLLATIGPSRWAKCSRPIMSRRSR